MMIRALTAPLVVLAAAPSTAQNTVSAWGSDAGGMVSGSPDLADATALSVGSYFSVIIRADGTLHSWGFDNSGQVSETPPGNGFVQVSAGSGHALALRADGSIAAWGHDAFGQVSQTPPGAGFIQVSAGGASSLALTADGSIVSWGDELDGFVSQDGEITSAPSGPGYIQIAAGDSHAVAVRADGVLFAWGRDNFGQVSASPPQPGFVQVSCGAGHSIALHVDGSIHSWGADNEGQVAASPSGSGYVGVAAGGAHSVAIRDSGMLVSWGWNEFDQVAATPIEDQFTVVGAGAFHSVALRANYFHPTLCNGDGGNQTGCTDCPCSNNSPRGTIGGCLNSSGTPARLAPSGSSAVSLPPGSIQDLRFQLENGPPNTLSILLSGDALAPINPALPCFGLDSGVRSQLYNGIRCAVVAVRRHGARFTDQQGGIGTTNTPWGGEGAPNAGIAHAGGSFASGQLRYFQAVYRDSPSLVCKRGLNTSQAVEVMFLP